MHALASFTTQTLPVWANWSQFLSGVSLVGIPVALAGAYIKHKCHHCKRIARFQVGGHNVPTCHRHRTLEMDHQDRYGEAGK